MPTTEQLLFFLCCLLALTPLLLVSLVLSRLSGEGTLRVELGERGVDRLTKERDQARAVAESLRAHAQVVAPVPTPPPVVPVTQAVPVTSHTTVTAGPEVTVTEHAPVFLDRDNGTSLTSLYHGGRVEPGTGVASTPTEANVTGRGKKPPEGA